jgi:hypothetical protein
VGWPRWRRPSEAHAPACFGGVDHEVTGHMRTRRPGSRRCDGYRLRVLSFGRMDQGAATRSRSRSSRGTCGAGRPCWWGDPGARTQALARRCRCTPVCGCRVRAGAAPSASLRRVWDLNPRTFPSGAFKAPALGRYANPPAARGIACRRLQPHHRIPAGCGSSRPRRMRPQPATDAPTPGDQGSGRSHKSAEGAPADLWWFGGCADPRPGTNLGAARPVAQEHPMCHNDGGSGRPGPEGSPCPSPRQQPHRAGR